jgi:hypothetical protein
MTRYETESVEAVGRDNEFFILPDGNYKGLWGGYIVDTTIEGKKYKVATKDGIRSFNVPCRVVIENGQIYVEL